MFKALKLRWKILFGLIGMSVLALAVTLYIVSGINQRQLEGAMQQRVEEVSNFAEKSIDFKQQEVANYVKLLARNTDLVNAVYYTTLTGENTQIDKVIKGIQEVFHLDMVQVRNKEGKVLLRSVNAAADIPQTTDADHPLLQAGLSGKEAQGVAMFDGQLSIVSAAPVRLQQDIIGLLVGVDFLNDQFAEEIRDLSGAEIAFYEPGGVVAASNPALRKLPLKEILQTGRGATTIAGTPYALFTASLGSDGRGLLMAIDSSQNVAARKHMREVLFIILAVVSALAALIGLGISSNITRPLAEVVHNLKEIAAGRRGPDPLAGSPLPGRSRSPGRELQPLRGPPAGDGQSHPAGFQRAQRGHGKDPPLLEPGQRGCGAPVPGTGRVVPGHPGNRGVHLRHRREHRLSRRIGRGEFLGDPGAGRHHRRDCFADGKALRHR